MFAASGRLGGLVMLALLCPCHGLVGQEVRQEPYLPKLAAAMTEFVERGEVAGVVSLVANRDGIVHCYAVGQADLANQRPMTADTIFWIASMSKPITAACIMMLQDEGKLSLDDPITRFLPEMEQLRMKDGTPVTIRLRHLLTHTSGMSELPADEAYNSLNLTEAATRYARLPVLFEPGTKWQYSQTSINTAARIVEVASGETFDSFLEKRLSQPLGMKDTTFYLSPIQMQRLAKSYQRLEDGTLKEVEIRLLHGKSPTDRQRFPAGNGGLFSTAHDYAKFCRMLLRQGELDGVRLLSASAVDTMRSIATAELAVGFTPGNGWGIGCCVIKQPTEITASLSAGTYGHGGAYGTQAWIDPEKQRVDILMIQRSNLGNSDGSELRRRLHQEASAGLERQSP